MVAIFWGVTTGGFEFNQPSNEDRLMKFRLSLAATTFAVAAALTAAGSFPAFAQASAGAMSSDQKPADAMSSDHMSSDHMASDHMSTGAMTTDHMSKKKHKKRHVAGAMSEHAMGTTGAMADHSMGAADHAMGNADHAMGSSDHAMGSSDQTNSTGASNTPH